MEFLFNDCSFHGQFRTAAEFGAAVDVVMRIRSQVELAGRRLLCSRKMLDAQITADAVMHQVVGDMGRERRQSWLRWLTHGGPFWSDERQHSSDDYLETDGGEIATDTAIGEAGFCKLHGLERELVSASPSDWSSEIISVRWVGRESDDAVGIRNHLTEQTVSETLKVCPPPYKSWATLEDYVRKACGRLTILDDAFRPLRGHPYSTCAAERMVVLLTTLNELRGCVDDSGKRTDAGNRLVEDHFSGGKAWFSDSSETEKHEFENELAFPDPMRSGKRLSCSWHGKIKTPQMRIHFSWPISASTPLYVVYVGPKITKR